LLDGQDTPNLADCPATTGNTPAVADRESPRFTDAGPDMPASGAAWLEARLGRLHARQRLGMDADSESFASRRGVRAGPGSPDLFDSTVDAVVRMSGMMPRGRSNAARFEVVRNSVAVPGLPPAFGGFTLLHLSDLHADTSVGAMRALPGAVAGLHFDVCVVTGDFRGWCNGPHQAALDVTREALSGIAQPIYGILGNHDSTAMLRGLEGIGIRMLMNESEALRRGGDRIWLAGVDDPHRYRTDDLAKALDGVPEDGVTVLLSHTADGAANAQHAGIALMLCGHTHGGQICLPGRIPLVTASRLPRDMVSGPWRSGQMSGYTSRGAGTSGVEARFNCPPEVTLHKLVPSR